MPVVIGVKFKDGGKSYYFDPDGISVQKGQKVIVETAQGLECGVCASEKCRNLRGFEIPLKRS